MELFTWAMLLTVAGATAAVLLILQFTKPLLPAKFPTRLAALILSFLILEIATAIAGGTWQQYAIGFFNSFVVATAAMGTYEVTFAKLDAVKKSNVPDGGAGHP
jgi:hypothetical protein